MKMKEIPEPVGKMIIESKLGEMTLNGLYVQYTDVVTLMKRYSKSQLKALKKENEELKAEPILLKQTISLLENRIEELKKWIRYCNITSKSKDKILGESRF